MGGVQRYESGVAWVDWQIEPAADHLEGGGSANCMVGLATPSVPLDRATEVTHTDWCLLLWPPAHLIFCGPVGGERISHRTCDKGVQAGQRVRMVADTMSGSVEVFVDGESIFRSDKDTPADRSIPSPVAPLAPFALFPD